MTERERERLKEINARDGLAQPTPVQLIDLLRERTSLSTAATPLTDPPRYSRFSLQARRSLCLIILHSYSLFS